MRRGREGEEQEEQEEVGEEELYEKLSTEFSAMVEKVEVDLLNRDNDNYNRKVVHSVKVNWTRRIT